MKIKLRLEVSWLKLERSKKRWNIYFIFATDHPLRKDKLLVTVVPGEGLVQMRKPSGNYVKFIPQGREADGLVMLERGMPQDMTVQGQLWVVHSRDDSQRTGDIVKEISRQLAGSSILGSTLKTLTDGNLWLSVSKDLINGMEGLGRILIGIKDRHLGYVYVGEKFDTKIPVVLERQNKLSTAYGEIGWRWVVEEK